MADGSFMNAGGSKENPFLATVDSIIQHWTQMWVADAAHDDAIAMKVQVTKLSKILLSNRVFKLLAIHNICIGWTPCAAS